MIVLASASPRRRELLDQIGVGYRVHAVDVDESRQGDEPPVAFVERVALAKARAARADLTDDEETPVLAADTAVILGARILGKPRDRAHALGMLEALSGRPHEVLTAVALIANTETVRISASRVWMRATTAAEREAYWSTGEPVDKAGAYAVQGRAAVFIERLEGSYSGVMGLPLYETAAILAAAGVRTGSAS